MLSFAFGFRNQYIFSVVLTALALVIVGYFKGTLTGKNKLKSSLQTLIVGGIAASIAFFVGYVIKNLIA